MPMFIQNQLLLSRNYMPKEKNTKYDLLIMSIMLACFMDIHDSF